MASALHCPVPREANKYFDERNDHLCCNKEVLPFAETDATRSTPNSGDVKFFVISSSVEGDDLIIWPLKLQILHIMISSCGGSDFGKDKFENFQQCGTAYHCRITVRSAFNDMFRGC